MYYFELAHLDECPQPLPADTSGPAPRRTSPSSPVMPGRRSRLVFLLLTYSNKPNTDSAVGVRLAANSSSGGLLLSPPSESEEALALAGHAVVKGSHSGAGGLLLSPASTEAGNANTDTSSSTGKSLLIFMVSPFRASFGLRRVAMIGEGRRLFKFS